MAITTASPTTGTATLNAWGNAATAAGYAPSVRDTRPWRWRLTGEGLDLLIKDGSADEGGGPDARLAVLSCGVALHHARTSLAADGWRARVHRLPDPAVPGHLARLRLTGRIDVDPIAAQHMRIIPARRTDRRATSSVLVDAGTIRSVTAAVEQHGALLHLLRPDQVLGLAIAADRAHREDGGNVAWWAELPYWMDVARPAALDGQAATTLDGGSRISTPTCDDVSPEQVLAEEPRGHSAVLAVLHGLQDHRLDWLRAGEALSAAWLTALEHGVGVLPLSIAIEPSTTRDAFRLLLPEDGHPYLVLRFGVLDAAPQVPRLFTHRRLGRA
jgi:hypothetical protein